MIWQSVHNYATSRIVQVEWKPLILAADHHSSIDLRSCQIVIICIVEAFNDVACSHQRSYWYFIESILSSCKFSAYPCNSSDDFTSGRCTSCGSGPCPVMGYDADKTGQRGTFYLKTNGKSPFCSKLILNYQSYLFYVYQVLGWK